MNKKLFALAAAASFSLIGTAYAAPGSGSATSSGATQNAPSTLQPGSSSASSPTDSMSSGSSASSQQFAALDADGDGIITKKEAGKSSDVKKQWSKLDTNKDGKLDAMEFSQFEAAAPTDKSSGSSSKY